MERGITSVEELPRGFLTIQTVLRGGLQAAVALCFAVLGSSPAWASPESRYGLTLPPDLISAPIGAPRHLAVRTPFGRELMVIRRKEVPPFRTYTNGVSSGGWDDVVLFEGVIRGRGVDRGRSRLVRGDVVLGESPRLRLAFASRRRARAMLVRTSGITQLTTARAASVPPTKRLGCGVTAPTRLGSTGDVVRRSIPASLQQASKVVSLLTPPRELQLGLDADFEFFQLFGSGSVAEMVSIINRAEAFYTEQVGVLFRVVNTNVTTSPFGGLLTSSDAGELLDAYRGTIATSSRRGSADIFHLFSGKGQLTFSGGVVVGLAYASSASPPSPGPLCAEPDFSLGLSQRINDSIQAIVTAHEIGHNFGARHPEGPQDLNNPFLPDSIMSGIVSGAGDRFSEYSRGQIRSQVDEFGGCVPPVAPYLTAFSAAVQGGTFSARFVPSGALGSKCRTALHIARERRALQRSLTGSTDSTTNPRLNLTAITKNNPKTVRGTFARSGPTRRYYLRAVTSCTVNGVKRVQGSKIVAVSARSPDLGAALRGKLR